MNEIGNSPETPIRNLRVRFWGVQGSCPLFPESYEVAEYKRMVTQDVIRKMLLDMQKRAPSGKGLTADELLGGPINDKNLDSYAYHLKLEELPVYGGDTTCISVETPDGDVLVLDGGSGIRNCSKFYMQRWAADKPRIIYMLGSHEHLDHRSGLPFSQFCYVQPPFTIHIYAGNQFLKALDDRYGIFTKHISVTTHQDDPIDYRVMRATFAGHELRSSDRQDFEPGDTPGWEVLNAAQPLHIHNTTVTAFDVYHGPVRCLAYKIQHGPASFLFCTDHELRRGAQPADPRQAESAGRNATLVEHCRGVDVAYFDGQYFRAEYDGNRGIGSTMAVSRVDWGHGCIEDIMDRVEKCGIPRAYIGHHDPERTWVARLEVDRWLRKRCDGKDYVVELAKSEDVIDL